MSGKMSDEQNDTTSTSEQPSQDHSPEASRREVLKRLGVYGAFVTALSSSASAQVLIDSGATN